MRLLMYMLVLSCVTAATPQAAANLYWIAYEGNDFPENEGWIRRIRGGGAERTLDNGVFRLNSLADTEIKDSYTIERQINPDLGEVFIAEWRLRIVENLNFYEAGIGIAPDFPGTLSFQYTLDHVISTREDWSQAITPLDFHSYRVESTDMVNYRLWIDGQFARTGQWDLISFNQSFFVFGDMGQFGGTGSVTEWDYVRFGVVPEPGTGSILLSVLAALAAMYKRRCLQ
jgi:hypothetical protein